MMGVPLEGPANVVVDNDSVVKNATVPTLMLQKKHNAICFHFVRENIAANVMQVTYIPSSENLADMFTKLLGTTKLKALVQCVLY